MRCMWLINGKNGQKEQCRFIDSFQIGLCPQHLKEYLITDAKMPGIGKKTVKKIVDKLRVIQVKLSAFKAKEEKARDEAVVH